LPEPLPPLPPRAAAGNGLPSLEPRPDSAEGLPPIPPRPAGGGLPPLRPGSEGAPPPPPAAPGRRGRTLLWAGAAVVGLGAAVGAGWLGASLNGGDGGTSTTTVTSAASATPFPAGAATMPLAQAVASVEPSVVQVRVNGGQGSGVITSPRGLIITNSHVIQGSAEAIVVTYDQRRVNARVVLRDDRQDLAVLQPNGVTGTPAILPEEPDGNLQVGDTVFAIGSPFGLRNSVTSGIVSALRTRGRLGLSLIQTDAPINPGNSGGGLFDLRGRLVGIPTSIESPIQGNVGIGYAVPASRVRTLLDRVP
jgi:S1-C subfamily serine protease